MKRILSVLLLCALLLTMLAACGNEPIPVAVAPDVDYPPKMPEIKGVEPMTKELQTEIEAAWRETYGYDMKWFNEDNIVTRHFGTFYLGSFDGYVLLCSSRGLDQYSSILIDPYRFPARVRSISGCFAYKDGAFTPLYEIEFNYSEAKTIYERLLAFSDAIYDRYDLEDPYVTFISDPPAPVGECPYAEENLLKAIGLFGTEQGENYFKGAKYLGTYHGCIVFISDTGATWDMYGNGTIAGVAYDLEDGFWLIRNGEVLTLEEAFMYGYLTAEDVRTVMYHWYGERVPKYN